MCKLEYQHNNPNRRAVLVKYHASDKYKAVSARYHATDKGKVSIKKWYLSEACKTKRRQQYAENVEAKREYYRKYRAENIAALQEGRARAYAKDPQSFLRRVKACDACKQSHDKYRKAYDLFVLQEARQLTRQRNELTGVKWHIDHIIPISKGGTHEHTNIQVVPAKWNHSKLIGTYFPRGEH